MSTELSYLSLTYNREAKVPTRVTTRCHSCLISVACSWLKSACLGVAGILHGN